MSFPKAKAISFKSITAMKKAFQAETDNVLVYNQDKGYPDAYVYIASKEDEQALREDDYLDDGYLPPADCYYIGDSLEWLGVKQAASGYCCGLPEAGEWYEKHPGKTTQHEREYLARAALLFFKKSKGYSFTTVTDNQKGWKEALEATGWKKRAKVKSNHGDYYIHMFDTGAKLR